ncbi:GcrA family cell cycle regulator [Rubellimicrobium aerolatum]|uniref:GcrA family cell cycle regulator n=1 Tax=Rubellimicrobium aerolatum TaxID=490979 RepID=A0ABW0SEF1_9RHOB|nr:GcrA family cell cycle regulator [Rubellimicrobium aerolatum]MBP1805667.1 GcrA cell cycle regulator [Rubellimicrobium aerolatum]
MSWTDERVETLKRMWGEGASASQIAKELGQVTRNAVIGKVHRLGLSNRVTPGGERAEEGEEALPEASAAAPSAARAAEPEPEEDADDEPEAPAQAEPEPEPEAVAAEAEDEEEPEEEAPAPFRRQIIPAGQPLPPQPSANEISPEAQAAALAVEKAAKRLSLMELTEKTCKWPVGDPATPNFWFCGMPVQSGKPYCEAHVGIAFQPMSARRDRRR